MNNNIYISNINSSNIDKIYDMIGNDFGTNGLPKIGLFDDDKIIGAILLDEDYLPWEYRFDIVIDKRYRQKGYSNLLIKELINMFKNDSKAEQLSAIVINNNLLRNLVDNFGFGESEFDGDPFVWLTKKDAVYEVKKIVREVLKRVNENFVYHGTNIGAAIRIQKNGLKGSPLFLSNNEEYSKSYGDRKGGNIGVILRMIQTDDMKPANNIIDSGDGYVELTTNRIIPPDEIEIKIGNKWIPIDKYDFIDNKILNEDTEKNWLNYCKTPSDNIRFYYIQKALNSEQTNDAPNLRKLTDIWDGYDDLVFVANRGDEIEYYEGFVDSCWRAVFKKDEYKLLTKKEVVNKLVNDRIKKIGEDLELIIKRFEFKNSILHIEFEKINDENIIKEDSTYKGDDFIYWLSNKLGKKINSVLGSGINSIVFDIGNNVIKITNKKPIEDYAVMNKNIEGIVKVYSIGKITVPKQFLESLGDDDFLDFPFQHSMRVNDKILYYVIMDKVNTEVEHELSELKGILEKYFENRDYRFDNPFVLLKENLNDKYFIKDLSRFIKNNNHNILRLFNELVFVLKSVNKYFDWFDIHPKQFGRNSKGELVAFDFDNYHEYGLDFTPKHTVNEVKKIIKQIIKEEYIDGDLYGYHVTNSKNLDSINKHGIRVGKSQMQGKGIYAFYDLDEAIRYGMKDNYGDIVIVKFKITAPSRFLILNMEVAKKVLGDNFHLVDQVEKKYWGQDFGLSGLVGLARQAYNRELSKDELIVILDKIENDNSEINQRIFWSYLIPKTESDILNLLHNGNYGIEFRINNPSLIYPVGYYDLTLDGISNFKEFEKENIIPDSSEYDELRKLYDEVGDLVKIRKFASEMMYKVRANEEYEIYYKIVDQIDDLLHRRGLGEARILVRQVLSEMSSKQSKNLNKCTKKEIPYFISNFVSKFNSDEELLRSGGIDIDMLDKWAFGFTEDEIKVLKQSQLKIRWHEDLDNVKCEIENKLCEKPGEKSTKENWAKHIDLSESIDVDYWESVEEGFERGFYIQDGHHRYYAAKILNKPLNINLKIKINPIKELSDLGYDEFHRCVFNKLKKQININESSQDSNEINDFIKSQDLTIKSIPLETLNPIVGLNYDEYYYDKFKNGISHPLIVTKETNTIEDGNHRYKYLKDNGYYYVSVVFVDEMPLHLRTKILDRINKLFKNNINESTNFDVGIPSHRYVYSKNFPTKNFKSKDGVVYRVFLDYRNTSINSYYTILVKTVGNTVDKVDSYGNKPYHIGGEVVGVLFLSKDDDGIYRSKGTISNALWVKEELRRSGIATAMHDYANSVIGIDTDISNTASNDASGFWKNRNEKILKEDFLDNIEVDEHGKNIVWKDNNNKDIFITIDDLNIPRYIALWDIGNGPRYKKGFLILSSERFYKGDSYLNLDTVEIEQKYRGRGYGKLLYKTALKFLPSNIKGISSYLPNRANKKQIPKIYKSFNSFGDDGDYEYISKDNIKETFTFGDLNDFDKEDLSNELDFYENSYEFLSEVGDEVKGIINDTISIFKKNIPIFDKIHIQLVNDLGKDALGMYIHESALRIPTIMLSLKEINKASKDGYGLDTIIKTTIYHELGHAMVDIDNEIEFIKGKNILNFDDEESFVEDFAFDLFTFNKVDRQFLKLSKLYKEKNSLNEGRIRNIIRVIINEEFNNDEIWYHGTPDVRNLEKEGGFTEKTMSIEYIDDIDAYRKLQDELKKSRELDKDRYFDLLDMVPKLKKQFKMRKPIFLTNKKSVARTYADPQRAFDYQGAVEKVLNVKVKKGSVVNIVATGDRFRFIDTDKVRRGFLKAGVDSDEFEKILNKFTFYLNNKKRIKTDMIAAIGEWFGFDYIDVIGVLDSYHGGLTKSTVRIVFNPGNIEIIKI